MLTLLTISILTGPIIHEPVSFPRSTSIQIDNILPGNNLILETYQSGEWIKVGTNWNIGSTSMVFILPVMTNTVFRAIYE